MGNYMAGKVKRLSKVARELNVGISTLVEFLGSQGVDIDSSPNTKLEPEHYEIVSEEFADDQTLKEQAKNKDIKRERRETVSLKTKDAPEEEKVEEEAPKSEEPATSEADEKSEEEPKKEEKEEKTEEVAAKDEGSDKKDDMKVSVVGKIDLDNMNM